MSEDRTDHPAVELTGETMFYCPSCEVLLGKDEAYEHTYSHRERGPNTGAVLDTFQQIPVAEPTTGPWNISDDKSSTATDQGGDA
jgi:hypothetical protein